MMVGLVSILSRWPDERATELYTVQYTHDSAGHGGQGERRREDEGRMGGAGSGSDDPRFTVART